MAATRLAHNVFFQLKDASPAKVHELVEACHKYLTVQPGIVFFAAGPRCAELTRDVNDCNWHVGLHIVFVDKAAHDAYQEDPTHNRFIEENKANWAAVRVFDSLV
ncbi:MAG: Dabb family protein [Gemmataceae bacterium]|nr:Dabb family protein [Gemmata sp.]MDW8198809.1 Dabb family protein [Gemmataceae bacterium]